MLNDRVQRGPSERRSGTSSPVSWCLHIRQTIILTGGNHSDELTPGLSEGFSQFSVFFELPREGGSPYKDMFLLFTAETGFSFGSFSFSLLF